MLSKAKVSGLSIAIILVFVVGTGCDDGDIGTADGPEPGLDSGSVLVDSTSSPGDGTVPGPITDGAGPPSDGADPPPPPKQDSGTPPSSAYGKICTANSECAANELCVKLASDSYPKTNPPPPKGMCLKKCSSPNAACSSSASHFYPCISASTWDLGAITVCAIACYTNFGGTAKTYACPAGTYCTRSFGGMMKTCTPYK